MIGLKCCCLQSARMSDRELVTVSPYQLPKEADTLLTTAVLGCMRLMPAILYS